MNGFHYSIHDKRNKPQDLSITHLKNKCFKTSAAEILTLMRNIIMILGHLVPVDNEHWELLILLQQLVKCVTVKYCQFEIIELLGSLIKDYLSLLQLLFPRSFKPKHHFLVRYGSVMKLLGPLWNVSSMNFERKNKDGKVIARASISRRDISLTIGLKEQLKLNYRLLQTHQTHRSEFDVGPVKAVSITS